MTAYSEYFSQGLFEIKCGSRSTKEQMNALKDNIQNFHRMEDEFDSINAFITSEPVEDIVRKLSKKSSKYKMKMFGEALAWEYLRNTTTCQLIMAGGYDENKLSEGDLLDITGALFRAAKASKITLDMFAH